MNNFVSHATALTMIAPAGGVISGAPVVIGSLLVVPSFSASVGEEFTGVYNGEFALAKAAADTPAALAPAYWNATNSIISSNIKFTPPAESEVDLPLVGFFSEAGLTNVSTVNVVLTAELN